MSRHALWRRCGCVLALVTFLLFCYIHYYDSKSATVLPYSTNHVAASFVDNIHTNRHINTKHYVDTPRKFDHQEQQQQRISTLPLSLQVESVHHLSDHRSIDLHVQVPPRRYVLGLNYWEQFTMATNNLFNLVCLGHSWNASTVEPFVFNSRLYGLRNFKADDNFNDSRPAHNLDLIYDTVSMTRVVSRYGLPPLVEFTHFLRYATRDVIVVHYIPDKEVHEIPVMTGHVNNDIRSAFKKDSVVDCSLILERYSSRLLSALNRELQEEISSSTLSQSPLPRFQIVKYFCVNMSIFTTPDELANRIGMDYGKDATVIFVNWRGTSSKSVMSNSAKGVHLNNRIAMYNVCRENRVKFSEKNMFTHSPTVLNLSSQFLQSLGLAPGMTYAVVHIRSEKLGLREPRFPGVTYNCFNELMRLKDSLTKRIPDLKVVYITDYGPYSSDTCRRSCLGSRYIKELLAARGIKPVHFDPALFDAPLDSGLAAAVETNLIASSTHLLLCGGGAYQTQAGFRFSRLHYDHKLSRKQVKKLITRVCTDDSSAKQILSSNSSSDVSL